jgi:SAM-dependent methyltransferase
VNNIDLDRLGISPGARVLDLGCGRGEQSVMLAGQDLRVVAADVEPEVLEAVRDRARAAQVDVDTVQLDVKAGLPEPGTYDAVVCTEVLEHVRDYAAAMEEIKRVLKPGGRACIAVPTALTELLFHRILPTYVHDSTHVNVFTRSMFVHELERAGLRVMTIEPANFEWTVFWLLHARAGTRFDHTGTPVENDHLTAGFWRVRRLLMRLRLDKPLIEFGNRFLPKSMYVYVERPLEAAAVGA